MAALWASQVSAASLQIDKNQLTLTEITTTALVTGSAENTTADVWIWIQVRRTKPLRGQVYNFMRTAPSLTILTQKILTAQMLITAGIMTSLLEATKSPSQSNVPQFFEKKGITFLRFKIRLVLCLFGKEFMTTHWLACNLMAQRHIFLPTCILCMTMDLTYTQL